MRGDGETVRADRGHDALHGVMAVVRRSLRSGRVRCFMRTRGACGEQGATTNDGERHSCVQDRSFPVLHVYLLVSVGHAGIGCVWHCLGPSTERFCSSVTSNIDPGLRPLPEICEFFD